MSLLERWQWALALLGIPSTGASPEPILQAYAAAGRAYHNQEHLSETLDWLDIIPVAPKEGALLAVALFYHDVVYNGHRSDNEAQSAAWAQKDLEGSPWAAPVADLILDTRHAAVPQSDLGKWIVDIDLSVLGSSEERFARYDRDVRAEYRWVPWFLYKRQRRLILEGFLARPAIYATDFFRQRLETPARQNLATAIARLR